jgi:hypothetical protein
MAGKPRGERAKTATARQRDWRAKARRRKLLAPKLAKQQQLAEREAALAEATLAAARALGVQLYGVLYVDPPRDPTVYSRVTGMNKHPANHYPTMPLADLAALKLPAAEDCVLYLSSPVSQLANALDLVRRAREILAMVDKAAMPGVAAMMIVDRLRSLSRPRALGASARRLAAERRQFSATKPQSPAGNGRRSPLKGRRLRYGIAAPGAAGGKPTERWWLTPPPPWNDPYCPRADPAQIGSADQRDAESGHSRSARDRSIGGGG